MSDQMKGNPYAQASKISAHLSEENELWGISQTVMALANELRTANLFAVYQTGFIDTLNDTQRLELEHEILERIGRRDV